MVRRFEQFYACGVGNRGGLVANTSSQVCNVTLHDYFQSPSQATCNDQANCMLTFLNNDNPHFVIQLANANVMLGLLPGLLASLGPTIGETSLLSSKVPILSFLVSLGAPSIYPSRPFEYSNPTELLKEGGVLPERFTKGALGFTVITLEYLLAAASVVNVYLNSYQLSIQTVFAPVCNYPWWVLWWTVAPIAIHLLAVGAYNTKLIHVAEQKRKDDDPGRTSLVGHHSTNNRPKQSWWEAVSDRASSPLEILDVPWWLKGINSFATFLAFAHMIFGVLIFSSLEFICVGDSVGVVGRYVASAAVCRLILMIECARMRTAWRKTKSRSDSELELNQIS